MKGAGEGRSGCEARRVTVAALSSILAYAFVNSLMSVLVNEIVDAFSLAGTSQGLISSTVNLGLMLALLAAPLIQGRVSKLSMLVFACALQAGTLVLCGISPSFLIFCGFSVFLGVGGGLADTYANSSIVDVHRENSARYLGYLHGIFGIGSLLAPLLIRLLLGWVSWRGVYYTLAAALLSVTFLLLLIQRTGEGGAEAATREAPLSKADLREYFHNRRNLALLLTAAFATALQTGILVWLMRYMTIRFDAADLGALSISIFWVCSTINRFCVARIKVKPLTLFIGGAILSGVWLAVGVLSGSPVVMCVMAGAIGFSSGHFMQVLFGECAVGYAGKTTLTTSVLMVAMGFVRILIPLLMAYVSANLSVVGGMLLPVGTAFLAAGTGFWALRCPVKAPSEEGLQ